MTTDAGDPVGVYFGTTSGEVWASADEGATLVAASPPHLPEIYSVESGRRLAVNGSASRTPLRSYTGERANVDRGRRHRRRVLVDLDRQFPGMRSASSTSRARCATHMVVWLDGERCRDLSAPVDGLDEVVLMQALSGG